MTKLHTLLILLLTVQFARADISFVSPMSPAECKQAFIDSMEMFVDSRYCEKGEPSCRKTTPNPAKASCAACTTKPKTPKANSCA